jgi:peptidoglycan hydrolase-like protein with peptidoglycan-binding domain
MRKITWLTGDYADVNNRQNQAADRGCAVTIDFHFNGNGPDAKGGEIWYKPADAKAKALGQVILDTFSGLGLPFHGSEPLKEAVLGNRASFIRHYRNPAILIEPLFVSNPGANQAGWIHQKDNVQALAQKIAEALEAATDNENSLIGLSIGHIYKPSNHADTGVDCVRGDTEADHARAVAEAVGTILTGAPVTAPPWPPGLKPVTIPIDTAGDSTPLVENLLLKSDLLKGNNILEAIAAGDLVLKATGERVEGIGPVQEALNQLGFTIDFGSSGRFKGFFGGKTEAAIKAFQTSANIDADGRVGRDTIKKLDQSLMASSAGGQTPAAATTAARTPAAATPASAGDFAKTRVKVFNRGIAPVEFLQDLVAWGKTAPDAIFADQPANEKDIYPKITDELGPFGDVTHRKACMLEVMRVLAGFESSWKWSTGRDTNNPHEDSPDTISAGPFQVSANSMGFGQDLRDLVAPHGILNTKRDGDAFQALMKTNHPVAMEYIARLIRHTRRANGPLYKDSERSGFASSLRGKEQSIYPWLSRDAVAEFEALLA